VVELLGAGGPGLAGAVVLVVGLVVLVAGALVLVVGLVVLVAGALVLVALGATRWAGVLAHPVMSRATRAMTVGAVVFHQVRWHLSHDSARLRRAIRSDVDVPGRWRQESNVTTGRALQLSPPESPGCQASRRKPPAGARTRL
jgi:hypothetical protein